MSKIIITDEVIADALSSNKTVTEVLAEKNKDEINARIKADSRMEKLDAFQMAMVDAGITKKSQVKDFYDSSASTSSWLFPAFVDKRLGETIFKNNILGEICANVSYVDSRSVNGQTIDLTSDGNKNAAKKARVTPGADLPVAKFATNDNATTLYKRGRALEATYEDTMYMTVDLFTKGLDYIANDVANQEIGDAIDVLKDLGTAVKWNVGDTKLTAERLVKFAVEYYNQSGIALSTIIAPMNPYVTINTMFISSENVTGMLPTSKFTLPQGILGNITILYADVPQISGTDQIIAVNKDYSLTKYVANGSQIREIDKNIRNQTELGTISEISCFTKFVEKATLRMKQEAAT